MAYDRLFLALWPSEQARAELVAAAAMWAWPDGAAPTAPERLHVTLHFIGAVPPHAVPSIASQLAVPVQAIAMSFSEPELWPGGVAVLVPRSVPAALLALHADLASTLKSLDLPIDPRPFRPHITLSWQASGAVMPTVPEAVAWDVSAYSLVRSLPGGAGYEVVQEYR
jgi:RNA 2',3'-cyclic 3'-phosphodiesterase